MFLPCFPLVAALRHCRELSVEFRSGCLRVRIPAPSIASHIRCAFICLLCVESVRDNTKNALSKLVASQVVDAHLVKFVESPLVISPLVVYVSSIVVSPIVVPPFVEGPWVVYVRASNILFPHRT